MFNKVESGLTFNEAMRFIHQRKGDGRVYSIDHKEGEDYFGVSDITDEMFINPSTGETISDGTAIMMGLLDPEVKTAG